MKLLIASVNYEDTNTMHINLFQSLMETANVTFYGPGFSSEEELEWGISAFIERKGPFDAVVCTSALLLASVDLFPVQEIYRNHRYMLSYYSVNQAVRYAADIVKDIKHINMVRILCFLMDYCNISETWEHCLKEWLDTGAYLLGFGEELVPHIEEQNTKRFGDNLLINNRYRNLVAEYPSQSISVPVTAVACGEYFAGLLENRPFDWVIPGNIDGCYPVRGQIQEKVKKAGYSVYDHYIDRTMAYKIDESRAERGNYTRDIERYVDARLGKCSPYLQNILKREEIARWRENYNVSLRESKIGFADGGDAHILVRKYFEIPARGTVLACENVIGMDKMGFIDGVNMVAVNPENVVEITRELLADPARMQQIANNGRQLMLEKHTSRSRAEDMLKAIEAILEGRYRGSYWEDGKFIVKENI